MNKALNFVLNIDLSKVEESEVLSNKPSLEKLANLFSKGYYLTMQPRNNRNTGEAYLWIIATKQAEDREAFSLRVNQEILNYVITILTGRDSDISKVDADNLDSFNEVVKNFELELYMAEKAQGKTMKNTYTTSGMTVTSYYKRGVIVYKPYRNPELKMYLNA